MNRLRLPNEYVFLVGTAYQPCLSPLQKFQRNDTECQSVGVKESIFDNRIKHFQKMLKFLRDEFLQLATSRKTSWIFQTLGAQ